MQYVVNDCKTMAISKDTKLAVIRYLEVFCKECGKHFEEGYGLKTHKRIHSMKGEFLCDKCDGMDNKVFNLKGL